MRCVVCQGDDIQTTGVTEEIKIGSDIICVPIETPVCRSCGERYYDRRTMRLLEETERDLREGKATVHEVGKVLQMSIGR